MGISTMTSFQRDNFFKCSPKCPQRPDAFPFSLCFCHLLSGISSSILRRVSSAYEMLLACRLFAYYVNVYQSDDKLRSHDLISPLEYMTPNIRRKLHVVPHLLFRVLNPDSCTMYMSPKKCVFLLTYLLTLSRAVPSPPILPTSTLNISAADTSLLNSTLTAVVPAFFQIIPSLPLDEPVLNARYTLMLTLHALGYLALDDFEGEQQSRT